MSIEETESAAQISYTYYSYEEFEDGRGYIGSRLCPLNSTPQTDIYLGSPTDKTFKPTAKIILGVYETRAEAYIAEKELQIKYNVVVDPLFANKSIQTSSGFSWVGMKHCEETKQKMANSHKGKEFSNEHRQNLSKANKGKKHTKETKQKISEARKGNQNMLGKKHTTQTKQKMSDAAKGNKNCLGKKWYNNGAISKMLRDEIDEIPEGFVKGRLFKK